MGSSPPGDIPEKSHLRVFEKAQERKRAGCDPLAADWQAILEIALCIAGEDLRDKPGQLLVLQMSDQQEWEFYLNLQKKLDLPPDTHAVLVTPSFSEELADALEDEVPAVDEVAENLWGQNTYLVIISDCSDHKTIMQVSLPSASGTAGIDVYEDGKHLADYTYNTIDECVDALARVPWIHFSPQGDWTREQITRYTENWFAKGAEAWELRGISIHTDFSYVHNPELLNLTPMESAFELLGSMIPVALESLESVIETTNELNQDIELEEAVVTRDGILKDDPKECQALAGRICLEMDQHLDDLEALEGVRFSYRNDTGYREAFDKTLSKIYETITGRPCPPSVTVW